MIAQCQDDDCGVEWDIVQDNPPPCLGEHVHMVDGIPIKRLDHEIFPSPSP